MKMHNVLVVVFMSCVLMGCSNKAIYNGAQASQRQACLNEPPSTFDKCMDRANKTYDEYQQERKELLENE